MPQTMSKVYYDEREFDEALREDTKRREESERNWAMYSGFDYGQWSKKSVSELRQSNRHVAQYNFVRGKVDGLAGSIVKNWFDVDFVPVENEVTEITRLLKGMFYSDKELLDWDQEYMNLVIDGLVHRGVEQMVISDRYNPIGNIGFERIMPGHIILDPNWKSHRSWDLKRAWKVGYYTPEELQVMFPGKISRIDEQVMRQAMHGMDYGQTDESSVIPYFNLEEIYGSKYRVIEYHYLKEIGKDIEIAIDANTGSQVVLSGSREQKMDFILRNSILVDGETIKKRIIDKEYWVKTFCPQLDDTQYLQDKKSEIQIGRLPFFPWSAARINGRDSGMVDLFIDIQQSINKRESLSEHIISTAAHGAKIFDPAMFAGDHAKAADFKKNINKPDAIFETAPGALQRTGAQGLITEVPHNQYSGEIYQELQRMSSYMDIISRQTATLEGRNESSRDSGVLFARRQLQSEIAQTSLTKGLQQHWNDKGEAYMLLAQQLYSGTYREFKTDFGAGGEKIDISVNLPREEDGGVSIVNNLRTMPRHKVVVSQSPQGVTVRATERSINAELLNSIPPELSTYRAQITQNIMRTLDMPAEEKARLIELGDLEMAAAIERVKTDIVANQTQQAQLQQQTIQQQQQIGMNEQQMAAEEQAALEGQQ